MIGKVDLLPMTGKHDVDVTLNEEEVVPVFGDFTHELAYEQFKFFCRLDQLSDLDVYRIDDSIRYWFHQAVGLYAKIGAIAAEELKDDSMVYEFGCGLAIPSRALVRLTGKEVKAIDTNGKEIEIARSLQPEPHGKLEFIAGDAESYAEEKGLNPNDVVIIAGPPEISDSWEERAKRASVGDYWMRLLARYDFKLVLSSDSRLINSGEAQPILGLEGLENFIENTFTKHGYGTLLSIVGFDPTKFVLVASKEYNI